MRITGSMQVLCPCQMHKPSKRFSLFSLCCMIMFIHPVQCLGWWKMVNLSVAQLESLKQPLPWVALAIRVERKLEDKKEHCQRKQRGARDSRQRFDSLVHRTDTRLTTSLLTDFLQSGTDMPAVSVLESSLNAKIIQQALPVLVFLSYLVVKMQIL